jgi:flagellar basal-body rod protein FlgC
MSGPFHSLSISGSGMNVYQTWLDAIADNVANVNDVAPTGEPAYQERFVVARARQTDGRPAGAVVAGALFGNALGREVFDPDHPYADDDGLVRVPDMSLSDQMTNMLIAQRAYQANVSAFRAGRDAYLRALEIGR